MADVVKTLGGIPLALDRNARDFESIRAEAVKLISAITPEWTDFYPADPGVALIEAMSAVADTLHYQIDRVQNESYLVTAQQRQSVVDLLRLLEYELRPPVAASVPLRVTTTGPVTIGAGWAVRPTASEITFNFSTDEVINLPAAGVYDITAVAGEVIVDNLGASTGQPRQVFAGSRTNFCAPAIDAPAVVVTVNGEPWQEVRSFVDSQPEDQHFTRGLEADGRVLIRFGDGVAGAIPGVGGAVVARYRIGGGAITNSVGVGTLTTQVAPLPQITAVTNVVQPSGGRDAQTLFEAKVEGPQSIRTLERGVTLEDYVTLAKQVPGVARARAYFGGPGSQSVVVVVVAEGLNPVPTGLWFPRLNAGTGLLGAVGRYLLQRSCSRAVTVLPCVGAAPLLRAVIRTRPDALNRDVRASVDAALVRVYRDASTRPDGVLPLSDVVAALDALRGVDFVNVEEFRKIPVVTLASGDALALEDATPTVVRLYDETPSADWEVRWFSGAAFRLFGPRGVIRTRAGAPQVFTARLDADLPNPQTASEWRITPTSREPLEVPVVTLDFVVSGSRRPRRGDRWRFSTDNRLGNIVFRDREVLAPTIITSGSRVVIDPRELDVRVVGGLGG
jgi:hypothetical protein